MACQTLVKSVTAIVETSRPPFEWYIEDDVGVTDVDYNIVNIIDESVDTIFRVSSKPLKSTKKETPLTPEPPHFLEGCVAPGTDCFLVMTTLFL